MPQLLVALKDNEHRSLVRGVDETFQRAFAQFADAIRTTQDGACRYEAPKAVNHAENFTRGRGERNGRVTSMARKCRRPRSSRADAWHADSIRRPADELTSLMANADSGLEVEVADITIHVMRRAGTGKQRRYGRHKMRAAATGIGAALANDSGNPAPHVKPAAAGASAMLHDLPVN